MSISGFDHVAIPIKHVESMLSFYRNLGFEVKEGDGTYYSVHFGENRINFHDPQLWCSQLFSMKGPTAMPGCGDFCFVWDGSPESLSSLLGEMQTNVEEGPVKRTGGREKGKAQGESIYIRDPDSNLLEFIIY